MPGAQELLGQKIEVYWEGDDKWYAGRVLDTREEEGELFLFIVYDDGEEAWIDQKQEQIRAVDGGGVVLNAAAASGGGDEDDGDMISRRDDERALGFDEGEDNSAAHNNRKTDEEVAGAFGSGEPRGSRDRDGEKEEEEEEEEEQEQEDEDEAEPEVEILAQPRRTAAAPALDNAGRNSIGGGGGVDVFPGPLSTEPDLKQLLHAGHDTYRLDTASPIDQQAHDRLGAPSSAADPVLEQLVDSKVPTLYVCGTIKEVHGIPYSLIPDPAASAGAANAVFETDEPPHNSSDVGEDGAANKAASAVVFTKVHFVEGDPGRGGTAGGSNAKKSTQARHAFRAKLPVHSTGAVELSGLAASWDTVDGEPDWAFETEPPDRLDDLAGELILSLYASVNGRRFVLGQASTHLDEMFKGPGVHRGGVHRRHDRGPFRLCSPKTGLPLANGQVVLDAEVRAYVRLPEDPGPAAPSASAVDDAGRGARGRGRASTAPRAGTSRSRVGGGSRSIAGRSTVARSRRSGVDGQQQQQQTVKHPTQISHSEVQRSKRQAKIMQDNAKQRQRLLAIQGKGKPKKKNSAGRSQAGGSRTSRRSARPDTQRAEQTRERAHKELAEAFDKEHREMSALKKDNAALVSQLNRARTVNARQKAALAKLETKRDRQARSNEAVQRRYGNTLDDMVAQEHEAAGSLEGATTFQAAELDVLRQREEAIASEVADLKRQTQAHQADLDERTATLENAHRRMNYELAMTQGWTEEAEALMKADSELARVYRTRERLVEATAELEIAKQRSYLSLDPSVQEAVRQRDQYVQKIARTKGDVEQLVVQLEALEESSKHWKAEYDKSSKKRQNIDALRASIRCIRRAAAALERERRMAHLRGDTPEAPHRQAELPARGSRASLQQPQPQLQPQLQQHELDLSANDDVPPPSRSGSSGSGRRSRTRASDRESTQKLADEEVMVLRPHSPMDVSAEAAGASPAQRVPAPSTRSSAQDTLFQLEGDDEDEDGDVGVSKEGGGADMY